MQMLQNLRIPFIATFILGFLISLSTCEGGIPNTVGSATSPQMIESPTVEAASGNPKSNLFGNFDAFIQEGYVGMDTVYGDLNLDEREDAILVLKLEDEEENPSMNESEGVVKRPLLILTKQDDGVWKSEGRNDNLVMCAHCGGVFGDPYDQIVIKKGYFSVEHYGGSNWRWTKIITFKYAADKREWFLHKDGGDEYNTGNPDKVESHVRTTKDFGVVKFADYDIYAEQ